MRHILFIWIFVGFFAGSGCETQVKRTIASEVISINPNEASEYMNLSEIVDSITIIPLRTAPEDVLGRIREVVVKNKYIYAIDVSQQAVFVFDKTGKFVSKLAKQGRGSNEYIFMRAVFIDDNEEHIEITNVSGEEGFLNKYSIPSFEYLEKTPILIVRENSTKRIGDTYYHATQQLDNQINGVKTNAGLLIQRDGKIVQMLFDKVIETNNSSFIPNAESFVVNDKNELFMSLMYDNTFYKIENDSVRPIITVDFEGHGMNNSIGLEPLQKQMEYVKSASGVALFPVLNLNNPEITSFSYYFKKDNDERFFKPIDLHYYVKFKEKTYHTKRIINDLTDFPAYIYLDSYYSCSHQVLSNGYLVDIFFPSRHLLHEKNDSERIVVEGIGEITIDDNPIVVMMKLKT